MHALVSLMFKEYSIFKVSVSQNLAKESNSFMDVNLHDIHSYILSPAITEYLSGTALGWDNITEREPSTLVLKEISGA